jgi:hypothetical protein
VLVVSFTVVRFPRAVCPRAPSGALPHSRAPAPGKARFDSPPRPRIAQALSPGIPYTVILIKDKEKRRINEVRKGLAVKVILVVRAQEGAACRAAPWMQPQVNERDTAYGVPLLPSAWLQPTALRP